MKREKKVDAAVMRDASEKLHIAMTRYKKYDECPALEIREMYHKVVGNLWTQVPRTVVKTGTDASD